MTSSVPEHDQWAYHPKPREQEVLHKALRRGANIINMQVLECAIGQSPRIDRIARLIRGLTYGHMMALGAELSSHGPITKDTLAKALWAWSIANANNKGRVDGTLEGSLPMALRAESPTR